MYNFKFGNNWISEFGAVSTEVPPIEIAQRKGELIQIPGKDGDDYIDNGSYKNVLFSRSISMVGKLGNPVENKVANLINAFAYLQGYQPFEDTDHVNLVTEAVLTNFDDINKKLRKLNECKLNFSRKPFWYLKSGLEYTEMDLSPSMPTITFDNPFMLPSKPLIAFTITGGSPAFFQYRVITNGEQKDYDCASVNGGSTLIIDCEKCNAIIGNIRAPYDIPEGFGIGSSSIQIISAKERIASARIAPRWRCL